MTSYIKICNRIGVTVTLNLLSNIVGDSNDQNNFPHKLIIN